MQIFDTHTHLNVEEFAGRIEEELQLAHEMGVTRMNVVGFDEPTIERALDLAEHHESIFATIGWHPTEAASYTDEVEQYLRQCLTHEKVIALGEIGLDYHWMTAPKEVQEQVFRRQIALSKEFDLPFVVHTRDALEDTYDIIKSEGVGPRGGIMHSYSGSLEMAERFVELGMTISFSGVVTFKKATDIQEAALHLPLDKILVETDAPYLAPVPKRGRENRTAYTRYVVEKIAELRSLSVKEVASRTYANAQELFGLKD
ncbi:TatD family hydrolase [Streptococcus sp. ZJ93]|uniref:TatD family hydrolase n=1 Tax=Streptococcus handemini TaxID=3161188 RepID=UPI0032EE8702